MKNTLIVPSTAAVMSVPEFQGFAKIDSDIEVDLLTQFIETAQKMVENITGRKIMLQTWRLQRSSFGARIVLPLAGLNALGSIEYYDEFNQLQTLDPSIYQLDNTGVYAVIALAQNQEWPAIYDRWDAISVTYAIGYEKSSVVPIQLKIAVHAIAMQLYESRGVSLSLDGVNAILGSLIIKEVYES